LGGPVRRGLDRGDLRRETFAVVDVLDDGQQQCSRGGRPAARPN